MFYLECVRCASVDMVSTFLHNYIVAHISRSLFALEITHVGDSTLVSELEETIELKLIPLISHNGCLHPAGETCLCVDSESES